MDTRFLVVGSGYAGTMAATRLARRAGPGAVTLLDPELRLVERVRLHEALVTGRDPSHDVAPMVARLGIALVRGRAAALDGRELVLEDGRRIRFERCIVATGSKSARTTPGSVEHAVVLEPGTIAAAHRRLVAASDVVVLGGGLTGIEVASEIAERMPSKRVTLVSRALGPSLTPRARAHVERTLLRLGVSLVLGEAVDRVAAGAVHVDGRTIACDLAIDTLGFASAAPAFLDGPRDALGRIRTDASLRVLGREDLLCCGDLAAPDGTLAGEPMIRGCQSAMPTGAFAADVAWRSACGQAVLPFAFEPNGYCVSLGRRDGVVDSLGTVFTGGVAAWIKERIVRYTVASMVWQARGWDYRWRPFLRRSRPALPAPAAGPVLTSDAA